jgi:hypothetical protein
MLEHSYCAEIIIGKEHLRLFSEDGPLGVQASVYNVAAKNWVSPSEPVRDIEEGKADRQNNVLRNAPHTVKVVTSDKWDRPYSREKAAFPDPRLKHSRYWPTVGRIDSVYGDRNLFCTCPPIEQYQ